MVEQAHELIAIRFTLRTKCEEFRKFNVHEYREYESRHHLERTVLHEKFAS
jgi:hypothetical protein